jgi:hypothetical protein
MKETIRTDYYVYAYLRQRDSKRATVGTPYYIGKGHGYRINEKDGHPPLPKKERRIKVAENLTEEAALDLEMELIEKYGRVAYDEGGILYNMSLGGEGHSIYRTEEAREAAKIKYFKSDKYKANVKKQNTKRLERMKADTEDGRMRRERKAESDKRYSEKPGIKEKKNIRSKKWYENNKEEILAKQREERATPEGEAKRRSIDKKSYHKRMQDPVKKAAERKYKREQFQRKLEQMSKEDKREFKDERNRRARENYRKKKQQG